MRISVDRSLSAPEWTADCPALKHLLHPGRKRGAPLLRLPRLRLIHDAKRKAVRHIAKWLHAPGHASVREQLHALLPAARIDIQRVSYGGASRLPEGLLEGRVSMSMLPVGESMDHIRSGRLRPLGVTSHRRSSQLPRVPTLHESGLPGFDAAKWVGLLAPARIPREIQQRLSTALQHVVSNTDVRQQLVHEGMEPADGEATTFAASLRRESELYRKLSKPLPIRLP